MESSNKDNMNLASEVLKKYEDDNEYHFYEVDRKWIIEAMEEYAEVRMEIVHEILTKPNHILTPLESIWRSEKSLRRYVIPDRSEFYMWIVSKVKSNIQNQIRMEKSNVNDVATDFIGVKKVKAIRMKRGAYNEYRGWDIPKDENPNDDGYLIRYPDGYESWSPQNVFAEAYRPTTGMTFGLAIEAMKKGHAVTRKGWNGKRMCVFLINGRTVDAETFHSWKNNANAVFDKDKPIKLSDHIDMKAADGTYVTGWLASQTDMLAEDWMLYE